MANNSKSRRSFLLKGILTATGAIVLINKFKKSNNTDSDTIKVMGKNGQVYEVDKKHVNKKLAEKASNTKLKSWLKLN